MNELSFRDILNEAMRNAALYRIILRMTIGESQAEVADLPEPDVVVEGGEP